MGLFWDFLRYGLPVGGAIGTAFWANKRGMTPLSTAGVSLVGWGAGYATYRLASRAANAVEGLPSTPHVPQVGQMGAQLPPNVLPFELPGPHDAHPPSSTGPSADSSSSSSKLWDKVPGAEYESEKRGKDGQPKAQSTVIDMTTKQPLATEGPTSARGIKPYDPGDSFGGGGSRGGV
jgi:hypothetical protein